MTLDKDLFLALLAMDSYNRGYGEALRVSNRTLGTTLLGLDANDDLGVAATAGFFAQAYKIYDVEGIADGTVVISFRGTDTSSFWNGTVPDIIHGWPMGAGLQPDQADLALSFYKAVLGSDATAQTPGSAILTGHSLGGGLGGVDKFEPVSGGGEMDHSEEAIGKLVVAGGDGAVDLEVSEHALDAVALLVERPIMPDFHAAV